MASSEATAPHAAVVCNPAKIPLDRLTRAVADGVRRNGWDESRWYETSRHDSGRRAAEDALAGGPAVVVVAGGDGTVRAVADVLQGSGVPVCLVPSGTGNLLSRNLGLHLGDVDRAVGLAFQGTTRAIDVAIAEFEDPVGMVSRHAFLVMAGIGLDAAMAEQTTAAAKRRLGWLAYVQPIARSILANRQFHLRYRVDGGRARVTRAHTVIVGNCGMLPGNLLLLPDAVLDDGLLDVVMLRPAGRIGWAGIGARLTIQRIARLSRIGTRVLGLAPDLRALAYAQGRRFDVRFDVPRGVQLDGDSFGPIVSARVTVRPAALRVCVEEN